MVRLATASILAITITLVLLALSNQQQVASKIEPDHTTQAAAQVAAQAAEQVATVQKQPLPEYPDETPTQGLKLELSVHNPLPIPRRGDYVSSGIPIPQSWRAFDPRLFALEDPKGHPIPAQVSATMRWGGAPNNHRRPIKWILVTFPAEVQAKGTLRVTLTYGSPRNTSSTLRIVQDDAAALVIDTGTARFTINKRRFSILDQVRIGNQLISNGERNGLTLVTPEGDTFRSAQAPPTSVSLEEVGPCRIVVRQEGTLVNAAGDSLTDHVIHLYFYEGRAEVRLLHTVGNHRKAMVTHSGTYDVFDYFGANSITFQSLELHLGLQGEAFQFLMPMEKGTRGGSLGQLSIYQESSGTDHWDRYADKKHHPRLNSYVRFRGYKASLDTTQLPRGDQFAGWLDVATPQAGVTVAIRDFWQNFPKSLQADGAGLLRVGLFPSDFPADFNLRVGEEKTHELLLSFRTGSESTLPQNTAQMLLEPMFALAQPEWYANSGAVPPFVPPKGSLESRFGQFKATDPFLRHQYYLERALMADPENTRVQYYYRFHSLWLSTKGHPSSTDYFDFYGWSWYGNQPLEQESVGDGQSGPFDLKYHIDLGVWLQYLATGDERWRTMGEAYARHKEALMLHDVITNTGWNIVGWKNAIFGHAQHNESGDTNSVRNHLGPVVGTGYGAQGAALHYLLTGYPPSREFALDTAEYAHALYSRRSATLDRDFAPSREAGSLLTKLNVGLEMTGDLKYHRLIEAILDRTPAAKQPFIHGEDPNSTLSLPTWIFGLYYVALGKYADLATEFGLETAAARARAELRVYLRWHLTYAIKAPQGWLTTYYYYNVNGNNDSEDSGMINNWALLLADAAAYGHRQALQDGQPDAADFFWKQAERLYKTGTQNPFFLGCNLIYSASKESVNSLVFGHVYAHAYQVRKTSHLPPRTEPAATDTHR